MCELWFLRNEYESHIRSNEHYLSSTESKEVKRLITRG